MKILVIGLCLSRNLGGVAMAYVLVNELGKLIDGIDFKFAVSERDFLTEAAAAKEKGLTVVPIATPIDYFLFCLPKNMQKLAKIFGLKYRGYSLEERKQIFNMYFKAFKDAELILNISGVSYVADGTRALHQGAWDVFPFWLAKKLKKRYLRFVQSFGPGNSPVVKTFARLEFSDVPLIFARGKESRKFCLSIIKNENKVLDFPDIAVLLEPAPQDWVVAYLKNIGLKPKEYVALSPSAVMAFYLTSKQGISLGEGHIKTYALIVQKLIEQKIPILFVPHMYSQNKSECDREVSKAVINMCKATANNRSIKIVNEDINPMQAKSLIGAAKFGIVSRYHALVAAISSATPAISIGWNHKYQEFLDYYGLADAAIDARKFSPEKLADKTISLFNKMRFIEDDCRTKLNIRQQEVEILAQKSFQILAELILKNDKNY